MRRCAVAIVVAIAVAACMAPDLLPGYRPASAQERASVMRVIDEYYALRTRAAVMGDVSPLYARHPRLAEGEVLERFSDGQAGELFVRFDLRREVDRWVIERTDQWTLGETAPPTPRP